MTNSPTYTLLPLDCRQAMRLCMAPDSVDSIVTDPPYDLVSIQKRFGAADAAPAQYGMDGAFARASAGFMGKIWDGTGVAFDPDTWREAYRVLKPGGHLIAFGGSRTYHRLACAIEDAGFEIRDQIMWLYGSGFPKSHDVSKAIDRMAGAEREVVGDNPNKRQAHKQGGAGFDAAVGRAALAAMQLTAPATPEAHQWSGWGTALKPAHEPIVLARKPLSVAGRPCSVAANVLAHGTGAINIDGCRVEGMAPRTTQGGKAGGGFDVGSSDGSRYTEFEPHSAGRFPANVMHDGSDEVLAGFPAKAGAAAPASGPTHEGHSKSGSMAGAFSGMGDRPPAFHGDSGSAARFFYCSKASKADREEGLAGWPQLEAGLRNGSGDDLTRAYEDAAPKRANSHPTVKPTALMRYLCRLVTPPGGLILDPFTGSGSTGKAALLEGFSFIGCEMTEEYVPIAEARLAHALAQRLKETTP